MVVTALWVMEVLVDPVVVLQPWAHQSLLSEVVEVLEVLEVL